VNKKFIQLFLFFLLILISFFFYKKYFSISQINENQKETKKEILLENENNLIKNLRYNVQFDNNTQYTITAELSEIFYKDDVEFVKMQSVFAEFVNEENVPLIIESANAIYNNSNYNTKFSENVKVSYLNNIITSQNLNLNFEENVVTIYNDVIYDGLQGLLKADNVVMNLMSKEMKIFMNESQNKVEIETK
tara:strand:+ start:1301 stop:1876 length:576 start_codon:yes stop_codon:yes gene_type:complete